MRPQVGQVINNKYRLVRVIGDGGMGSVYEARHEVLATTVALKFLHPELSRRAGLVQRFLQEARVSAQIQSPHVVRVSDVDQMPTGQAFIVMEYLEGKTLQTLYEDLYNAGQRLSYNDALEYAWNEWVLAYGPDRQRELLAWLGWRDIDWSGLVLLLIAGLAAVGLALALWNRRARLHARDPLGRSYARFCARLAAIGLARQTSEGPLAYAARIARLRPDLADATGLILGLYARLRYGGPSDPPRLRELHARVRRFRPRA